MRRLTIFIKGNVDVHDSLHSCRIGGELVWNGINEVLRTRHPGWTARIKHETWSRSDALLQAKGVVPVEISCRNLSLGSYPASSQFSRALFETKADAIVLSIQTDVASNLFRHKKENFLFYTMDIDGWSTGDRDWLKTDFDDIGLLKWEESMANFSAIIKRIREQSDVPIMIYNMSPIIPGEMLHCYQGMEDAFSTRIRKFNLGLIELSETTGISIIDIDSIVARKGADHLQLDTLHLNSEGYRLVTEEVVRVLADTGVFDGVPE